MLFNSYEFIFLFFPLTLAAFYVFGGFSRSLALGWLIVASLGYYAWWRPENVFIIVPAILLNFVVAKSLQRITEKQPGALSARLVLTFGILFNVVFLGYFKYANFARTALNDLAGTQFVLTEIILPLGISFITFQVIAFLVDVYARRVNSFSFRDFALFVLFFPQLIAGPIVHFRETMPQFKQAPRRLETGLLAVGLTLFCFGLFKKVVLADGISPFVSPLYETASATGGVTLFSAWLAAAGFTVQMYFDFSGYSDMACGLALCFGVRLPINFDSPLKAGNIIDFWLRWHITLTRFLTSYLYNPLALWITRRRMARGLPPLGARGSGAGAFLKTLAAPTILTMTVSGLWHGAGYLFLLWGLLHGIYITVNHAWRATPLAAAVKNGRYAGAARTAGFVLTLLSVIVAMVLFRAPDMAAAVDLLKGMIGMNGISLPQNLLKPLGGLAQHLPFLTVTHENATHFLTGFVWLGALGAIALLLPNSIEILARYEPVLGARKRPEVETWIERMLGWRPSVAWAFAMSALAVTAVLRLSGEHEFLYWQF